MNIISDTAEQVQEAGLRYLNDTFPGFKRSKKGDGFVYLDHEGEIIKDETTLNRISQFKIPPAWVNVWISPKKNSHLQVTGFDEKGRKQYLYHPEWIEFSQQNKFDKLLDFGMNLPKLRSRVQYDIQRRELDFRRVVATVVWLLENTMIRVGNDEYAKENKSYGLTTLRNKHVEVTSKVVKFEFVGKSGVKHSLSITHPRVSSTIKKCIELPGYELFQYIDDYGKGQVVDSSDVNAYLKETSGEDLSAKDFRTWGGTILSAVMFYQIGDFGDDKGFKKNMAEVVKKVAKHLRNTTNVCKNYYIHPTVIKTYTEKKLIPHFSGVSKSQIKGLSTNEYRVLDLLKKYNQ